LTVGALKAFSRAPVFVARGYLPSSLGTKLIAALNALQQAVSQTAVSQAQLAQARQQLKAAIRALNTLISSGKVPPAQVPALQALSGALQAIVQALGP
jgi:cell division protein FtsB